MKFPTRQLGMSVFPAALNEACFTYSTSSQAPVLGVFRISRSNKWSIVFVIIGPATALKRQAQSQENEQEMCVFHGGAMEKKVPRLKRLTCALTFEPAAFPRTLSIVLIR